MRKNMLNKLHEGHLGIEKTRKLARDSIFWPGINAQITDFISKCSVCLESRRSNTKEPMAESETPELPWMTNHEGFNGPHYNGLERFVQSVKKMLSKSKQDGKDPYIVMLKYRNTPLENLDSPAQLLLNRRLRTTIPTIKNRLTPKCGNLKNTQRKMKQQKMNQKQYYDKSSKPLPELQPNDTIRFQHNPKGKWDQGTVVRNNNTPNSYVIETPEGQIFKRNRKHLLKTKEDKIEQTSLEEANENNHNDFDNMTDEHSLEPSFVRRSERSVKKPTRLIEEC
ncbi:unnamed protein product [Mytilus coruscus]|uniref:Integrase zinc-binding domain-containing protein n=1 Tax=Mytilus coruscus TaxID=42192 RepID=A0A6J8CUX6_MYTCO|nr:unnamed protein product [Mytilus coruscus]